MFCSRGTLCRVGWLRKKGDSLLPGMRRFRLCCKRSERSASFESPAACSSPEACSRTARSHRRQQCQSGHILLKAVGLRLAVRSHHSRNPEDHRCLGPGQRPQAQQMRRNLHVAPPANVSSGVSGWGHMVAHGERRDRHTGLKRRLQQGAGERQDLPPIAACSLGKKHHCLAGAERVPKLHHLRRGTGAIRTTDENRTSLGGKPSHSGP